MDFIKKTELQLINGGYLANKAGDPVNHESFVAQQNTAHYLVSLATAMGTKDYVGKEADEVSDTIFEVSDAIYKATEIQYMDTPKAPAMKTRDAMTKEALAWIGHKESVSESEEVNIEMQKYNVVNDFEAFGLYFTEGLVKLHKIYSIKEILEATKIVKKNLNN